MPNDQDLRRVLGSMALSCPLEYGDVVFFGIGEEDNKGSSTVRVCVERKRISDMVNSVVGGRYLYQAQSAHDSGMDILVLIIEGPTRPNPVTGLLETISYRSDRLGNTRKSRTDHVSISPGSFKSHPRKSWEMVNPGIPYSRFDQYLTELDYLAGIIVKRSSCVQETAAIIKALWVNFQTPPSKHSSLHQIYSAPNTRVTLTKPGLVRRMSKELKNVGWERSIAVARCFPSVREMVNATVEDWKEIDGIGEQTARSVVRELSGGSKQ